MMHLLEAHNSQNSWDAVPAILVSTSMTVGLTHVRVCDEVGGAVTVKGACRMQPAHLLANVGSRLPGSAHLTGSPV